VISTRKSLEKISPSLTLALKAKVDELKKQGIDVVSFTVGEPDFHTPDNVKVEAFNAVCNNVTKYTAVAGLPELRDIIVEKFAKENGLTHFKRENVVVGNGGKQCLYSAIYVLTEPGDDVLIPAPYWLSYPAMVLLAGANPVIVPSRAENNYILTPEELEKAITPKTKVLILNSPSNPTGSVYQKEDLEALIPVIKKHNLFVISDEIYEKLVYDHLQFTSLASFEEIRDQVVIVNGVSKSFAMTGWRIGYAAGHASIIKAMSKINGHLTGNACSVSQRAAYAAIKDNLQDSYQLDNMQRIFEQRRNLGHKLLQEIPGISTTCPKGAFYLFINASAYYGKRYGENVIHNSTELANYLLDKYYVAVVPGLDFGDDRCFRISFATSEAQIEKGITRIKEALLALQ
jgi:aspartate aminotransferase